MILLNPGPANTTETVKRALVCEDVCPRERSFGDVMGRVSRQLVQVVLPDGHRDGDDAEHVAVLIGGSGTAAVEAAIASAVPADGRLLVVDNGAYGTRIAQIAAAYGIAHDVEAFPWGDPHDVERVIARLESRRYTQLAVVHHETTTGMLNPVEPFAAPCRALGVELIVDAMSSYAGVPIDLRRIGADYLMSSANKCIQGMAGLSFVICRRAGLERMRVPPGRSFYLNLREQQRFFEKEHQMRFTPPVQVINALAQALEEYFAEGRLARWARYEACFAVLDEGVRGLGFRRLLPERWLSKILTAYVEPDHPAYGYDRLHDALFARGFTIYPGKGAKEATFRLANMGAITPDDLRAFVAALGETIEELGIRPLYAAPERRS